MTAISAGARRWLPVAVIAVVVDQLTKHWALSALADGHVIDLPGPGSLRLSFNTGIAFSQGRGKGIGPVVAALGMVIIVVLVTRVVGRVGGLAQYAVGLIVGGAIGNLIDRVTQPPGWLRGGVIDFIQAVPWFPVFNVADACITVGGAVLLVSLATQPHPDPASTENDGAHADA